MNDLLAVILGVRTIAPEKNCPRLGVGFGLALVLELELKGGGGEFSSRATVLGKEWRICNTDNKT